MAAQGISIATSILGSLLAQHTARLQDATNENEAVDNVIPAFDADLKAINDAYNSGGTSAADCIAALQEVDNNIFSYLYSLHGKPGTAWTAPTTAEIGSGLNPSYPAPCNKSCTAACCVYENDLRPAIYGRGVGFNTGCIEIIQRGSGTVQVPAVAAPPNTAYGNYARPAYALTFTKPANVGAASIALQVSGVQVQAAPIAPSAVAGPVTQSTTGAPSGIIGTLSNTTLVAIVGLIGGILLIITALFGQNALRVNK